MPNNAQNCYMQQNLLRTTYFKLNLFYKYLATTNNMENKEILN